MKKTIVSILLSWSLFTISSYASDSEIQIRTHNFEKATNNLETNIFTDNTCSELIKGVKDKEIKKIKNPFLKELALQLYNNTYDTRLSQQFNAIVDPTVLSTELKIGNGFSKYQNVTGIFLPEGENIVFAKNIKDKKIKLLLPNWMRQPTLGYEATKDPNGWGLHAQTVLLEEGVNIFNVENGTLAYIDYFETNPEDAPQITINFATGKYNGYFDAAIHTDEDWNKLLDNAISPIMDAVGKYIQVAYPVEFFKEFAYGRGHELINSYEKILLSHYRFMGLEKYNRMPVNKILSRVNFNYYMFRDKDGVAYLGNKRTMKMVVDPNSVTKGDPCWGFSHEVGHVLQMRPQLTWGGMTEVSNNLFTLYTTIGLGNVSRLKASGIYTKARENIIFSNPQISYLQDDDFFCRLVPFWQLHLYFSRNNSPDFYADLMEEFRSKPDLGKGNESYKNMFEFIKATCDYGKIDLTDFFEKWGFFYVGTINVKDYGNYTYNITQKEVDAVKEYIASKNYPKPSIDITTLEDN